MNILLFTYYNPLSQGGFQKQALGLFKTLIKEGHKIACLTISNPDRAKEIEANLIASEIFELGCVVIPYREKPYSFKAKFLFWLNSNPATFLANQQIDLCNQINNQLNKVCVEWEIDYIHCLSLRTTYFIPDKFDLPVVIDLVDSFTLHKKRIIKYQIKNQNSHLLNAIIDFWKTRRIEKNILSYYAKRSPFTVVSSIDAQILKQLSSQAEVHVVCHPIALKQDDDKFLYDNQENNPHIVFYGFIEQIWNRDALIFLVKEIIPLILVQYPNIKLYITGYNLSEEIINLAKKI